MWLRWRKKSLKYCCLLFWQDDFDVNNNVIVISQICNGDMLYFNITWKFMKVVYKFEAKATFVLQYARFYEGNTFPSLSPYLCRFDDKRVLNLCDFCLKYFFILFFVSLTFTSFFLFIYGKYIVSNKKQTNVAPLKCD